MGSPIAMVAPAPSISAQKIRMLDLVSSISMPSRKSLGASFGVELAQGSQAEGEETGKKMQGEQAKISVLVD
jgi:hypothetical protein